MAKYQLRSAAPDFATLFTDLTNLFRDFNLRTDEELAAFMIALRVFLAEIRQDAPPPLVTAADNLKQVADHFEDKQARDWAGFFAAMSAFMAQILPLILPLFTKTKV